MIWNPARVKTETANTKLAPPYDGDQDLTDPDSAIMDFLAEKQGSQINRLGKLTLKQGERARSNLGDETYWYISPPEDDVIRRENDKKSFFANLQASPKYQQILNSSDLSRSDQEWNSRLPVLLRRH